MVSAFSPRWFSEEKQTQRPCDVPGCDGLGEYKAPRSRDSAKLRDYHWFCLEHVTEYNKSWNYFAGMSEMEIDAYWQDIYTNHRPTWKRDGATYSADKLGDSVRRKFADYFVGDNKYGGDDMQYMPVDRRVKDALADLDLDWPVTLREVKLRFKELVKIYHPDVNKTKDAEERFKRITKAYQLLCDSLHA